MLKAALIVRSISCSTASLSSDAPASNTTTPASNIIECTEPSLTIVKTPAIYTSAYTSGAEWTGKVW
jgi:hypothetical protein